MRPRRLGARRRRRPRALGRHGGLCRLRDGVGKHASAARVHAAERGAASTSTISSPSRRRAAACCARRREDRRQRVIVPPMRRRLRGGLPCRACLLRAGAQPLHAPRRLRRGGRSELLKEMSVEATALVRPARAGMATSSAPAFMRYVGQGTRSRSCCPARVRGHGCGGAARGLRARLCRAVRAPHPQCRHRDPELVGPGIDRGQSCRAAGCCTGRAVAKAGRPAAVFDGRSGRATEVPVYAPVPAAGSAICRAGDRRRG